MISCVFFIASMAAIATAAPCGANDLAPLVAAATTSVHAASCASASGFSIATYVASPTTTLSISPSTFSTNADCQGLLRDIATAGAAVKPVCTFNGVPVQQLTGQSSAFWLGTDTANALPLGDKNTMASTMPASTTTTPPQSSSSMASIMSPVVSIVLAVSTFMYL
ncbi:Aste57867_22728 [Aphanomyces stellatus]|uniref:Aste57867_22728 protein n=1 Tax=Aphanomyces stellatus TaxID=120398 RepID=A0A485LKY7_9STRA|nr:hypothetical protein As57867_022658 [Aphanomyces stellatus]VFT99381.1 Aste57867_22728 [Aphanomyces stellatus]